MAAQVELTLEGLERALLVPTAAVFSRVGESYVYVVTEENEALERRIEVGVEDEGRTQILKGLQEGERVVTDGTLSLADGVAVEALP